MCRAVNPRTGHRSDQTTADSRTAHSDASQLHHCRIGTVSTKDPVCRSAYRRSHHVSKGCSGHTLVCAVRRSDWVQRSTFQSSILVVATITSDRLTWCTLLTSSEHMAEDRAGL